MKLFCRHDWTRMSLAVMNPESRNIKCMLAVRVCHKCRKVEMAGVE